MTKSPTAQFLAAAIKSSGLTQREISQRAGFPKPNVISMMKLGETKVPIDRIPALAEACGADEIEFARTAMLEYHPDLWGVLNLIFDPKLTDRDITVLRILRQADPDNEILWKKADKQMVYLLVQYMLGWMQHTGETASK